MAPKHAVQIRCGAIAGPLFIAAFTAIGAMRRGYHWQRLPVSSLALGRQGWLQRGNFIVTGLLYSYAAAGLARSDRRCTGPRTVPVLIGGAGLGLIGSGLFVTDYIGGPERPQPTRTGQIHDLCGIPVFIGIPIAALTSTAAAVRNGDYRWACYSAGSSTMMAGSLVLMGGAIKGQPSFRGKAGLLQRFSIVIELGWLSSLSIRVLRVSGSGR
jgi:hypothetical protein